MSKNIFYIFAAAILLGGFMIVREVKKDQVSPISISNSDKNSLVNPAAPQYHKWREFTSVAGNFKVLFPTLPQHANDKILDSETGETRRYDTYVAADENGQAFMISVITYPKAINKADIDTLLQQTVEDMIKRKKENKLIASEPSKHRENNAIVFSLTNGQIFVSGKAFVVDNTVYILSLLSKGSNYDAEELAFFINSFSPIKAEEK